MSGMPHELLNKIFGFLGAHPNVIAMKKEHFIPISEALFSRKLDGNYEEQWVFWTGNVKDPQFQAVNCIKCGQYQASNTFMIIVIPEILCTCEH